MLGTAPALWNELYGNLPSTNFGVGGAGVVDQINRIVNENVLEGYNAKVAVVMIGTNNLWDGMPQEIVQQVADNIRILINHILQRQPIIRILLLGILPRSM